ncbi:putative toxin-antitoxin system toxin component, PIN family [Mucilaginibacter sp. X4EP1]|jgi:putative PIN family toxin of toxin-antitoxin system|uniref:putative toxin-antitoxin system toxin component, PIN family n=1 Tax=Mucilaginibacter sp. X4EP1 TaxID=2723092 RepID=UPI0021672320|nr:putative toxin-antitoxin system toxin component, PIN family [Mucilaginibacter sp. X4EP1]MCS3813698.1 putative PIN family toxin of toxin-antitoxin system [Mucilaginibacter sp. X4EP1]
MVVVFDTNIWISLAINKQLDFFTPLYNNKKITIASCEEMINELIIALSRPKFSKYFPEKFIKFHQSITVNYKLPAIESVVADEKDNYLFALCKITNAHFFITGDKLLLNIDKYHNTSVVTLIDFKKDFKLT